ncbi:uncharacterized protein [Halyomorpha halys]|uniref:uncharacterized protein n=1 Tax=Halyomorpha halys TaxID=286706 RepID=UPI000D0C94F2|nr:uncharacterized protein LOC112210414 [Halyomorpha halys]
MIARWSTLVALVLSARSGGPENDRQKFAAVPWSSPLRGHIMNVVCPMQDDYLERKDLSALHLPAWVRTHEEPVGRCPVKYHPVMDSRRIWPPILIAVECACERSRCTLHGSHVCITVYIAHTVLKHNIGFTKELLSVDCICAARTAKLVKFSHPKLVT